MKYYYSDNAKNLHGPIEEVELARLATNGIISRNTPVCKEGAREWVPAKTVFPAMWPDMPAYQNVAHPPELAVVFADNTEALPSVPKATPILSTIASTTAYMCFFAGLGCLAWAIVADSQATRIQAGITMFLCLIYGFFMLGLAQLVEYIHLSARYLENISRRLK